MLLKSFWGLLLLLLPLSLFTLDLGTTQKLERLSQILTQLEQDNEILVYQLEEANAIIQNSEKRLNSMLEKIDLQSKELSDQLTLQNETESSLKKLRESLIASNNDTVFYIVGASIIGVLSGYFLKSVF